MATSLHGLDPICMTKQRCLKVEPTSLLTITEPTASPDPPQQQAHTQLETPRATHTVRQSLNHSANTCLPSGSGTHTHASLNVCPRVSKGQVCTVLVLCLHEILLWQLAYQQFAVQQLQDCPPSWAGRLQDPFVGNSQHGGQNEIHCTEGQSML